MKHSVKTKVNAIHITRCVELGYGDLLQSVVRTGRLWLHEVSYSVPNFGMISESDTVSYFFCEFGHCYVTFAVFHWFN